MRLVDTNVLLDLVTNDPDWADWSLARLEEAALAGPVAITDTVYAEVSVRYERMEDLDAMLEGAKIDLIATPRAAAALVRSAADVIQHVPKVAVAAAGPSGAHLAPRSRG